MLPKCEGADQVTALADYEVIVLIESPLGALTVAESVQADNAIAAMWGAEDLVAALGGNASRRTDGSYRDVARHVRSQTLLAAKSYGRLALDSVYLDIKDLDGLREETLDAVAVGFDVKVSLHPTQVAVVAEAYPSRPAGTRLGATRPRGCARTARGVRLRGQDGRCPRAPPRRSDRPSCGRAAREPPRSNPQPNEEIR